MNSSSRVSLTHCLLLILTCCGWVSTSATEKVTLLAFGDWGWSNSPEQQACARQMAIYAVSNQVRFDAAFLLGDNFYHKLPGGVNDPRWAVEFEQAYDPEVLDMPFYAALGNHDYEGRKAQTQLAYAKQHPEGRWTMPAKWYRVEIPENDPLVSVMVLDSNFGPLSKSEWEAQSQWLKQELQKTRPGEWTVVIAHHPLYTSGWHGDGKRLLKEWGGLLEQHQVDFFLCGHDHDLQHLEIPDRCTSFILAGGGGAKVRPIQRNDRGPFARSTHGFFVLRLTPTRAEGRLISSDGAVLHTFTRTPEGQVSTSSAP